MGRPDKAAACSMKVDLFKTPCTTHVRHNPDRSCRWFKKKRAISLRQHRIDVYKSEMARKPYSCFEMALLNRQRQMLKNLEKVKQSEWENNFDEFYFLYSYEKTSLYNSEGKQQFHAAEYGGRIHTCLKQFGLTRYGASVVYEMLTNEKRYKDADFFLVVGTSAIKETGAGPSHITFAPRFPLTRYPTSQQFIYPPATIYHEFGHTMVFTDESENHELGHEAAICRVLENPMRMEAKYEPRYTYVNRRGKEQTINLITGDIKSGRLQIKKDDPSVLVARTSAQAFHP